jgi:hypothetical protein
MVLHLQRREASRALPPLPAVASSKPDASVLSLLQAYIVADADRFDPDPGSRPWLLAQALAGDEGGKGRGTQATVKQGNVSASATTSSTQAVEEELPEDRFLRQDALSLHFMQQREADKAARVEKDKARSEEPMVKEITYEPGKGHVETVVDMQPTGRAQAAAVDPSSLLEDLL